MVQYLEEKCCVLGQLGKGLKDIWMHRRSVFFLSFFSFFLFYGLFVIVPFFLHGKTGVNFSNLFSLVSVSLYSYIVLPIFELSFYKQPVINSINAFFSFYIMSVLSVLFYRFFLKKEKGLSLFSGYLDSYKAIYIWLWYAIYFSAFIFMFTVVLVMVAFRGYMTFPGAGILGACLLGSYLCFRFTFTSLFLAKGDGVSSLKNSWDLTKGKFFSLLLACISVFVIVSLVFAVQSVSHYVFSFLNHFFSSSILYFIESAVDVFFLFFMWIWIRAFISRIYLDWQGQPCEK